MRSSIGRFGILKKQKFSEQHFVPELLSRREIGLPPAGAKTNELIVCTCIRVGSFSFIHVLRNISHDRSV